MLARSAPGIAPFNVNYRYVAAELRYLLRDAGARAIQYHAAFAPTPPRCCPMCTRRRVAAGRRRLRARSVAGAIDYEEALAASGGA